MKVVFKIKKNEREIIFLTGTGYSGSNNCVVFKKGNKISCECLDQDRRAECDISQMSGDIYGTCCPLYKSEGLVHLLKKNKKEVKNGKFRTDDREVNPRRRLRGL